jgi:Ca2+-binding EF-hand superfamily protein
MIRSMKRPGLTRLAPSATLFLILASAIASQAQDMTARAARKAEELLKLFDKNGDGKLDDDERAEAKEQMMKEQVDRQMARAAALPGGLEQFRVEALQLFDLNRDGRLDDEERSTAKKFAAAREAGNGGADELNKRFDKNGDGSLDAEERARVEAFLSAIRAVGSVQTRFELLRRFDVNGDGKIDEAEFPELEKFIRARLETSPEQLRRHDTNGDGVLDDAEWTRARAAIAEWLNGPNVASLPSAAAQQMSRPSAEREQARLEAVAKEVERRRAIREKAMEAGATPK